MEPTNRTEYDPRIDVLRALACAMVAIVHVSVPTWTNPIVDRGLILDTVVLGLIHTGWLGVPLFLFLSGFSLALNKTHPSYVLDKGQFFINRVLRIYPVWIMVILILSLTHKLSGANVFTLLLMQTQDIPPSTAFNVTWSLQLEFMCYLLFPVLLSAVATRKSILICYLFFLSVRLLMYMVPATMMFQLSYGTVFGGATLFLTGILAASLPPILDKRIARIYLVTGIAVFCGLAVFIWKSGGYQAPNGKFIGMFFLFMPEILSATIFLIVRGYITPKYHNVVLLLATEAPFVQRAIMAIKEAVFNALVHFGKVSYSAYVFSLFTHDFTSRVFSFIKPMGWISMILALILYFSVLTLFATLSFNAIEKPFLKMRRLYVRHA